MNTPQLIRSFIASVALEGGRLVKLSGGQLVYCGAGEQPLGVLETAAAAGESADVLMAGFGKIQVAAALEKRTGEIVVARPRREHCLKVERAPIAGRGGREPSDRRKHLLGATELAKRRGVVGKQVRVLRRCR